tara:strand:- start:10652 stop:11476 length:825 start_codon:yes stop_codon:yes gene_type:complete
MRIALCFHGFLINGNREAALYMSHNYINKNIFSKGKVDVFFHSWDQEQKLKDLAKQLYDFKIVEYETPKDFKDEQSYTNQQWFDEGFDRGSTDYKGNSIFQTLSFLYSRKRCLELKSKYEKENNFKYDVVILARTDIGTRGKEHPQEYYVTNIDFNPNYDMNYVYAADWNQHNWGYPDHWFYSSSENMDLVATAYDKVLEYYQPDSEYTKSVTTGWIDSNKDDQFSNEIYKENKSKNLVCFPKWQCIDNHKFYKWFFYDVGLYSKTKFLNITGV